MKEFANHKITQQQETIAELEEKCGKLVELNYTMVNQQFEYEKQISGLKKQNEELVEALKKSNTQIKYLHSKFRKETGTGRLRIMRNEILISKHTT